MGPKTIEQPFEKKSQAMILKVGTDHQGLKVFKFYIVDLELFYGKVKFSHCAYTRPRCQVSVSRTICPLVYKLGSSLSFLARLHEVQKSYCSHHGRTRSHSRSTLLKFSRSLYLGNHSSESIHTWTIGTQ